MDHHLVDSHSVLLRHHDFDFLMIYSTVNHQKLPFSDPTHLFDDVILEWPLMKL